MRDMQPYLVEYKVVSAGGLVHSGVEMTYADAEIDAQRRVEDWLRIVHRKAEIHIGDAVTA